MREPAIVFMFSGQGSYYPQMGRELFEQQATFRRWMAEMDGHVRKLMGLSIVSVLYGDARRDSQSLHRTLLTHPAIFMVQFALAQTLIEHNVTPDYVLGASMGAFAAATIAGCIGLEEALAVVVKQALTIEECCQRGGMIAIFSDPILHEDDALFQNSELAAVNVPLYFVVAAKEDRLDIIEAHLRYKRVTFQRLPVSYAFHSRWIDDAKTPFVNFLETFSYKPAKSPIVCCAGARILTDIPHQYFWSVVREPIRFAHTVAQLENQGTYRYIDVGGSGSLATFLNYALPSTSSSEAMYTLSPFGHDLKNLQSILAHA